MEVASRLELGKAIEMAVAVSVASDSRMWARAILYRQHLAVPSCPVEWREPAYDMTFPTCIAIDDSSRLREILLSADFGVTVLNEREKQAKDYLSDLVDKAFNFVWKVVLAVDDNIEWYFMIQAEMPTCNSKWYRENHLSESMNPSQLFVENEWPLNDIELMDMTSFPFQSGYQYMR